jgi:hypothetical protein
MRPVTPPPPRPFEEFSSITPAESTDKSGGEWEKLEITHMDLAGSEADPLDIIALDDALKKLSELRRDHAKQIRESSSSCSI